jgi:hypothetical protein
LAGWARLARRGEIRRSQEVVAAPGPCDDGPLHLRDKASWDVDLIIDDEFWARIDVHIGTEIDTAADRGSDLCFNRYIDLRVTPHRFAGSTARRALAERSRPLARVVALCVRSELGVGGRLRVEAGADDQALAAAIQH